MKFYYYLFYKIYCGLRNLGKWDLPFKAMVALSTLLCLNILELFFIVGIFPLNTQYQYDYKIVLGVICAFLLVLNWYVFLRKKNYLQIEKQFKKESKTQKIIGDIAVILYVIFTLIFVLFLPRFVE